MCCVGEGMKKVGVDEDGFVVVGEGVVGECGRRGGYGGGKESGEMG